MPQPSHPPRPIPAVDRQATAVGLAIVAIGVGIALWSLARGDTVLGVGFWLGVAAWVLIPAFPAARTFRWSSTTEIERPPAEVLDRLFDPGFVQSVEATGDYDPAHARRGSLAVEVIERTADSVRYRQVVSTVARAPIVAEVMRTVDRQAGVIRSHVTSHSGGDTVEVVPARAGSRVTYSTELRFPYTTALAGVWLMHGRIERGAVARQAGVLARAKAALEKPSAGLD